MPTATAHIPAAPAPGLLEDVSADRMMDGLGVMARWTKLAGTEGEAACFAWLQQQLEACGLTTRLIAHDAYISLPGPAHVEYAGQRLAAITHSMAISSPPGGLAGSVVDLGDGSPAAFAARDVRGRIVLVDGIASPAAALRATRAGAAGVVHVSPHHLLHEMCVSPVWGNPSLATRDALPGVVVVTVSAADGASLRQRLAAGELRLTLHAAVDTGWRKTPLLVGEMAAPREASGAEADAPFVLLSCHVDTWFYGVMDNGSANISMLEAVRLCAARREAWQRGLRVCFWSGHSQGRYSGSSWYADQHWHELDRRCVAHVNLDSPGGVGATVLGETGSAGGLFDLAAHAISGETNQELAGRRKARSADDSFPGIGIPSVFGSLSQQPPGEIKLRNALGWWWHTEHDLIDKIDPDFLVRDTRIVLRVVWALLSEARLPLDYARQVAGLCDELDSLAGRLAGRFDLAEAQAAARRLRAALAGLRASPAEPAAFNRAVMQLSRAIVPLDYTNGDRFVHDAALPLAAWPVLAPLRRLAETTLGDAEAHFAEVDAVRARNRLIHGLNLALAPIAALQSTPPR